MKLPHLVSWMGVEHVLNRKHHTWWQFWVEISVHLWGIEISMIQSLLCLALYALVPRNASELMTSTSWEKVVVVLKGMGKGLLEDDIDDNTPGAL